MKRRLAVVAGLVAALAVGGSAAAQALGPSLNATARDTSGCVVLLPDAPNPVTVCLFPR